MENTQLIDGKAFKFDKFVLSLDGVAVKEVPLKQIRSPKNLKTAFFNKKDTKKIKQIIENRKQN